MAKKRRLEEILAKREKAKQNTSNSRNVRQISTGLPTTRQQMVMPRSTTTEVQALAQSLYNRRSDMTAEQQRVASVAQNYTPIKQNGLAPSNEDKNKAIVQNAVANYNPNFRNEKNLSKEAIKYNPEAKQLTTWDKVQQTANKNTLENQDKKWYQKFVQKSGAFDDGYQVGDLSQATGATALEGVLQVVKPFSDLGTGLANIGATGVAQVADWIGKDEFANRLRKAIGANESVVDKGIKLANQDSVLGDTTDTILNAFGQYGLNAIGGQALGKAGQMKILGVNAPTLSVISSFGQGLKNGYSDEDYKNWQVYLKASGDAVIEGMTEGINDVLGVGGSTLSDMLKGNAMKPFKSGLAKALARTGLSSAEEGLEEVLSYLGSLGLDNLIGYLEVSLNQGDGEKWKREFNKDEFWENFWVGTISALVTEAPNTAITHNAITQKAIQDKTNELSRELTQNEKQQISKDAILNYETNIQKDYTKGNKITNQIKNSGLTENQQQKLTEVAEKYDLSQADIQNLIDNTKNGKYEQNQATTIENKPVSQQGQQTIQTEGKIDKKAISLKTLGNDKYAIKMPNSNFKFEKTGNVNEDILDESMSKYFNNSSETKKLNQTFKTIMRDKGIAIKFDENVTDADGNIVDGKYENGVMTINPNSERAFEYIATHELTHAIGTKQMIDMVERFRKSDIELEENVKTLLDSYAEGDITEEALADISAQLFGTQEFIANVKNTNPNLFQKIYNEIKYLWHQFRGYKNQNEFIEDLYNKWTKAYNSNAELNQITNYLKKTTSDGIDYIQSEKNSFVKEDGTAMTPIEAYNSLVGKTIDFGDGDKAYILKRLPKKNMYEELFKRYPKFFENVSNIKELNTNVNNNIIELLENSKKIKDNDIDKNSRHKEQGITNFDTRTVNFYDGNNAYVIEFSIAKLKDGTKVAYAKKFYGLDANLTKKIKENETMGKKSQLSQKPLSNNSIASNDKNVNNKQKQLEIILKNNSMQDDYHVGIRTVEDIKTFEEAMQDDESFVYGDFSKEDAEKALERGVVTVYSSKPIENGGFVSTSRNMAKDYAGSGKIYSKEVPLNDVAWINGDEGQYAKVDNAKYLVSTESRRNIEQKIDRYSRIVEQMQKEGRNSDEWAPYANEILRLEDQLETGYLRQGNKQWQEYLEKNFKSEGTRTYGKDIRAEQPKKISEMLKPKKKISEVFKKNVLLDNTIKSKKYTGKKQTNNEIAKILDTPKERQKPEDRKWAIFKANILDKGIVFEDLSKKAKNRELEAKWDYTLSSGARGQYAIGNARYEYVDGKKTKVAKGLTEIIDEVGDKVSDFQNYMYHQLNVDRMSLEKNAKAEMERMKANELFNYDDVVIRNLARKRITDKLTPERKQLILDAKQYVALSEVQNKPVFGKGVTEFHSKNKVAEFEKNNPEFKKWAKDVYDYLKADKMELVKNGVISEELSSKFEQLYPHYVPIQRVDKNGNAISVPLDTRRTGINTPIKEAKGGNSDIGPLFQTMANRTMQTYRASARNSLGLELRKTLQQLNNYNGTDTKTDLDNIIESMENESENNTLLQASSNGRLPTFTVFENGNKVTFDISEDVYDALKPKDSSSLTSKTSKILNTIGNVRRGLLTEYNPLFSVTNTIKDAQDVLANSQHALKTYLKFPEAYQQILQKGYWYEEYMQNGGEQNSYFKEGDFVKEEQDSKIKGLIKLPLEKISQINNVMEMAPRLAEYMASREAGRSIQTSMLDASRVTTNFKAGGDVTKALNRNGATFLNAGVQGTMQVIRNFREANMQGAKGYAILASKMAVMGLPVFILNNLIWDDDEEYDELQDYVKDSYYIVGKTKDGNFIRIPKGRFVASVQKIVSNVNDYLNNKKELNIDNVSKDLWESLGFAFENMAPNNPIENNVASPIFQVANNTSWYGEDIVPQRLQNVPDAEQYDETTDAFSIWLGDKLNVSPMKINYLLDQYGGGVADILLPMGTKQAENNVIEDKFTTNPTMKSKYPGEFFEKSDEIEVQSNSMNATDEDIVKNKYMADISGEMSKLYKEKRKIQNSDATDESKKEQLEKVQEQINEFAKTGIEEVDKAKVNQYIAEVGDKAYYKDDEGKWKEIDKEKDLAEGLSLKTYADYKNKVAIATDKKRIEKNNDKATLSDSEKSQILLDSNYTEKEKRLMYPKYVGDDDKTYEYLSRLTGDKVNINQYLDYKTAEIKGIDDPKSIVKGKTKSGSKKANLQKYLRESNFSEVEALYIYGTQNSLNSTQRVQITNYINKAKQAGRLTASEEKDLYKKLNSVEELENGQIRWK